MCLCVRMCVHGFLAKRWKKDILYIELLAKEHRPMMSFRGPQFLFVSAPFDVRVQWTFLAVFTL